MPGQATVTINDKQWLVAVANTSTEITSGLSGVSSIPAQTGALFDLGHGYSIIPINMSLMLFPLDIIFIDSNFTVVGVLHDVQPNDEARFEAYNTSSAKYFLEVNAGEAEDIEVGNTVSITGLPTTQALDLGAIFQLLIATVICGGMIGLLGKGIMEQRFIYCPVCKRYRWAWVKQGKLQCSECGEQIKEE